MERFMGLVRKLDELKCTDSNAMYLYSDPSDDIRHPKNEAGAYEWWYFDAVDPSSGYGIVIIFYDGLLFSPDYHKAVESGHRNTANFHPGFSLSIYNADKTVFYSLATYNPNQAIFGGISEPVTIGLNKILVHSSNGRTSFEVHVDETLPSGLRAHGTLRFESLTAISSSETGNPQSHHRWNLVQPSSHVTGEVVLEQNGKKLDKCGFNTRGYHDHNIGMRALDHDFDDWYWGRIHIGDDTLVWYNISVSGVARTACWLFEKGHVDYSKTIEMLPDSDTFTSIFGLKRSRSWRVRIKGEQFRIVDTIIWDNGPFYQRYKVSLVRDHHQVGDRVDSGIAEYIKPNRIAATWVRPMIRIRHHRAGLKGNWIQRFAMLARRTW